MVLTGDGDSVLGNSYLPANVGSSMSDVDFEDGVSAETIRVTRDDDDKTITVRYAVVDDAETVLDVVDGADDLMAVLITAPRALMFWRTRPSAPGLPGASSEEGRGGFVGVADTEDVTQIEYSEDSVTIDITTANEAYDTGIAVPDNTKTILLNYGAGATGDNQGRDLLWIPFPIEEWNRLDAVVAGDTPTQGNARFTRLWRDANVTTVGGVQGTAGLGRPRRERQCVRLV